MADRRDHPRADQASTVPVKQPESRVVNLSDVELGQSTLNLLGRGPNFALGRSISAATLHMVEMGVQRAIYGLKWSEHINEKRTVTTAHNTHTDGDGQEASSTLTEDVPNQVPLPRPHFSDSYACQPPYVKSSTLEQFRKLKYRIVSAFRSQKTKANTVDKEAERALKDLANNDTLIVKQSDKCKSLVVMSKPDYISKASDLLRDYERVASNPTPDLEARTRDLTAKVLRGKVPDHTLDKLVPRWTRTAEFYGLPKTHKPDSSLRPIVSACGDPLDTYFDKYFGEIYR